MKHAVAALLILTPFLWGCVHSRNTAAPATKAQESDLDLNGRIPVWLLDRTAIYIGLRLYPSEVLARVNDRLAQKLYVLTGDPIDLCVVYPISSGIRAQLFLQVRSKKVEDTMALYVEELLNEVETGKFSGS